jgi:hypothetical protein
MHLRFGIGDSTEEICVQRDKVRLNLLEDTAYFAFTATIVGFVDVSFVAVELRFTGARDEKRGEARRVTNTEDVLERTEDDRARRERR